MTISRRVISLAVLCGILSFCTRDADAQNAKSNAGNSDVRQPLTNGYQVRIEAFATNKEMLRQKSMWIMEVTFKSMRMRWVYLTDPKTKLKKREIVWYLVYKAVARPLDRRVDNSDTKPQNVKDAVPPLLFVPEFTLVATDGGRRVIYRDVIIPEAYADIAKREFRKKQPPLKDGLQVVGPVPAASPIGAKKQDTVYGVALWRGVDPDTDFLTVYMSGFSNSSTTINGIVAYKTIIQRYQRPGDRFFQTEAEFKRVTDGRILVWPSESFSTGTIGVESGVVTSTGGDWPKWAGEARLEVSGNQYLVKQMNATGTLALVDAFVTIAPGTPFVLIRMKKVTFPAWIYWPEDAPAIKPPVVPPKAKPPVAPKKG